MARRTHRTTATVAGATLALAGLGLALPAQANAAVTCMTVRPTVMNFADQTGGIVQATVCKASDGYAYLDDSCYNYVQDYQADGVAARACITDRLDTHGPPAVDDTSTSGGQPIYWESAVTGNTTIRVWVCLGTARPGASGARCSSATV